MREQKHDEIYYRRQAFKFFDKGKSNNQILKLIPCSRSWLFKWKKRYRQEGWSCLQGLSKTPNHLNRRYDISIRQTVIRVRRRMEKESVGLCGARSLFFELKRKRLVKGVPSISTIKRWLKEAGFGSSEIQSQKKVYYPRLDFGEEIFIAS